MGNANAASTADAAFEKWCRATAMDAYSPSLSIKDRQRKAWNASGKHYLDAAIARVDWHFAGMHEDASGMIKSFKACLEALKEGATDGDGV